MCDFYSVNYQKTESNLLLAHPWAQQLKRPESFTKSLPCLTVSIPVVSVCYTSKALLSCRVPDLQLHFRLIHCHHLVLKDTYTFIRNRHVSQSSHLLSDSSVVTQSAYMLQVVY